MASIPYLFTVRDNSASPPGTRKTGLTPTWVFLKRLSDLADLAQPAITEIAQGQYQFAFDAESLTEAAGQIDAGAALTNPSDRYIDVLLTRDSSRVQTALPNSAPGSTGGLPNCQPGVTGDGTVVGQKVVVAPSSQSAIASVTAAGVVAIAKASGAIQVVSPVSDAAGQTAINLTMRDDYTDGNGQPIIINVPSDWPSAIGVPLANISLGFGPTFGVSQVLFTASAIVADHQVKFAPTSAQTGGVVPDLDWSGTFQINYPSGGRRSAPLILNVQRSYVP